MMMMLHLFPDCLYVNLYSKLKVHIQKKSPKSTLLISNRDQTLNHGLTHFLLLVLNFLLSGLLA